MTCKECNNTGTITLLTSVVPCRCKLTGETGIRKAPGVDQDLTGSAQPSSSPTLPEAPVGCVVLLLDTGPVIRTKDSTWPSDDTFNGLHLECEKETRQEWRELVEKIWEMYPSNAHGDESRPFPGWPSTRDKLPPCDT